MGPTTPGIRLTREGGRELLRIRGFKSELVGPDGESRRSPEFMCHVNLDMDPAAHRRHFGVEKPGAETAGAACLPGRHAAPGIKLGLYEDPFGRKMTGHWVVPPGRDVRRTVVTKILNLPFDTTLHDAGVHLHPFALSLELRDLTAGKTVFRAQAENIPRGIGLSRVATFTSVRGEPVYKDHEYELVSVFDNTTPTDQDAMASMFLYLRDKEYRKPSLN